MCYFAKFREFGAVKFRLDTRIYLQDCAYPNASDHCVAAIVGKNPGSAAETCLDRLATLSLQGDQMLPAVKNRFVDAYRRARKAIPDGAFVRVWNLFYLCDPKLQSAIKRYEHLSAPPTCPTEKDLPPIVWFAWGGGDPDLDSMKDRFRDMSPTRPFFYDKNLKRIVEEVPNSFNFPKHTQGLVAEPVVEYLSKVL